MKVLLAVDGSPASMTAVAAVKGLRLAAGSELTLLTVVPHATWSYGAWPVMETIANDELDRESVAVAHRLLRTVGDQVDTAGVTVRTIVRQGRPASEIVDEAGRRGADVIVVGARGVSALERVLVGSVSCEVVDHAPCAVLVARTPVMTRVLVATDGSADADCAAEFIARSGIYADPVVKVLSVVETGTPWWAGLAPEVYEEACEAAQAQAAEAARSTGERLGAAYGVATARVRGAEAASVIVEEAEAWGADVVVLGTRGHGVVERTLVGSTSRRVLHKAPMSVLVVRRPSAGTIARTEAA